MLRYCVIDAFTDAPYSGNPAAVVWLPPETSLTDDARRLIAREFNLSETAFVQPRPDGGFALRWFTPTREVELCGHATLATCRALSEWQEWDFDAPAQFFTWRKGTLSAERRGDHYVLHFPQISSTETPIPKLAHAALGGTTNITAARSSKHSLLLVLENETQVANLAPDHALLAQLHPHGVIVTSNSDLPERDFVSRFFAPNYGIDEDPVCGSAHCVLGPFWRTVVGKSELSAEQLSPRGGTLQLSCPPHQKKLQLSGRAELTFSGTLRLPAA